MDNLYQEATMPIEDVIAKYEANEGGPDSISSTDCVSSYPAQSLTRSSCDTHLGLRSWSLVLPVLEKMNNDMRQMCHLVEAVE